MKLTGGNSQTAINGWEKLPGAINYLEGKNLTKWQVAIPTYAKVKYTEVYPGIDLLYYGNQEKIEYDFLVAPGSDPAQIQLAFEGTSHIDIAANRDLFLTTDLRKVRLQKPAVYQLDGNGQITLVVGEYVVQKDETTSTGAPNVQIHLAAYDQTISTLPNLTEYGTSSPLLVTHLIKSEKCFINTIFYYMILFLPVFLWTLHRKL